MFAKPLQNVVVKIMSEYFKLTSTVLSSFNMFSFVGYFDVFLEINVASLPRVSAKIPDPLLFHIYIFEQLRPQNNYDSQNSNQNILPSVVL